MGDSCSYPMAAIRQRQLLALEIASRLRTEQRQQADCQKMLRSQLQGCLKELKFVRNERDHLDRRAAYAEALVRNAQAQSTSLEQRTKDLQARNDELETEHEKQRRQLNVISATCMLRSSADISPPAKPNRSAGHVLSQHRAVWDDTIDCHSGALAFDDPSMNSHARGCSFGRKEVASTTSTSSQVLALQLSSDGACTSCSSSVSPSDSAVHTPRDIPSFGASTSERRPSQLMSDRRASSRSAAMTERTTRSGPYPVKVDDVGHLQKDWLDSFVDLFHHDHAVARTAASCKGAEGWYNEVLKLQDSVLQIVPAS